MDALELTACLRLGELDLELDLAVGPGETLALLGPSGAGKTTVLRVIAGLVRPQQGRVSLGPRVLLDTGLGIDLPPEERGVGMVFQDYALFPNMSVLENVAFADREGAPAMLERFGLASMAGREPASLSGGERQRVALARAMARGPDILLLDEPLSALDAQSRGELRGELAGMLAGVEVPTVIVTHDPADVEVLATRAMSIDAGRVVPG
ncbi:MAG: ATP-binding cassette domain-containing protein [Solirubrobacteraceae bacterium]|nr:ATP-binding cassette domain-containing protein [Solirubrobacteraceae bacterium]